MSNEVSNFINSINPSPASETFNLQSLIYTIHIIALVVIAVSEMVLRFYPRDNKADRYKLFAASLVKGWQPGATVVVRST